MVSYYDRRKITRMERDAVNQQRLRGTEGERKRNLKNVADLQEIDGKTRKTSINKRNIKQFRRYNVKVLR